MIRKPLERAISVSAICSKMCNLAVTVRPLPLIDIHGNTESTRVELNGFHSPLAYARRTSFSSSIHPVGGEINTPLPFHRPSIVIINNKIQPLHEDPFNKGRKPIMEDPLLPFLKIIEDGPGSDSNKIEKHAARLIVIRRTKMNKHKLRKLRKKMKYVWEKAKTRRAVKKEKAFLNAKMALIRDAEKFDAKKFVEDCIQRAKEVPIDRKWTDPLMPDWYKQEELMKEQKLERYKKVINLYLNKSIEIKPPRIGRYTGEKKKVTKQ